MNFFPNPAYISVKPHLKKQEHVTDTSSSKEDEVTPTSPVQESTAANLWFGWIPKKV